MRDNNILTILTSDDRDEVRESIKQLIIEQVKSDLEESDYYIFDPDELQEMLTNLAEEVKEEIKPLIKEKMFGDMMKKLELL
ncbi:MAG TPA: hypothetical protein GX708_24985 [Gallicola sp.]|nr:hypothetical protein [Gallicola sp.]